MAQITKSFEKERDTKNKVFYKETGKKNAGTIYLMKDDVKKLGDPESLTVTMKAK